jgi:ankyrin repeat protein
MKMSKKTIAGIIALVAVVVVAVSLQKSPSARRMLEQAWNKLVQMIENQKPEPAPPAETNLVVRPPPPPAPKPPVKLLAEERYATGQLWGRGFALQYEDGRVVKQGLWTNFWVNGKLQNVGNFENGHKVGKWAFFMENGMEASPDDYPPHPTNSTVIVIGPHQVVEKETPPSPPPASAPSPAPSAPPTPPVREKAEPLPTVTPHSTAPSIPSDECKEIRKLAEQATDVNTPRENGGTLLMDAAYFGDLETVKLLIAKGANVNAKTNDGWTVLMAAARAGNLDVVKLLLKNGAEPNVQTWGPHGKKLTGTSFDGNGKIEGPSPLFAAAEFGFTEVVKALLEGDASPHLKGNNGQTSLLAAVANGHTQTVELLLERGSLLTTKDHAGKSALMLAVEGGYIDIVEILLRHGAKTYQQSNEGLTVREIAVKRGDPAMIALLQKNDTGRDAISTPPGVTPDEMLSLAVRSGDVEKVKTLLDKGANPTRQLVDIVLQTGNNGQANAMMNLLWPQ